MSFIKNKKGFTLVEVLVSITLFGIIAIAFSLVFVAANAKVNSVVELSNINAAVVSHIKTFGDKTGDRNWDKAQFYNVFTEIASQKENISFEVQLGTTQHIISSSGDLLIGKEQPTKSGTPAIPENERFYYLKPNSIPAETKNLNTGTPNIIPPWNPIPSTP